MKLASLRDGTPGGRLVVVSGDLTRASDARHVAPDLGAALADWERASRELTLIARGIEIGAQPVERFHERDALAPLPAAGVRIAIDPDGAAHRRAPGAAFADPRAPLSGPGGAATGLGFSLAIVTGELPAGAGRDAARAAVRLVMLAADIGPGETALSPVAMTLEGPGNDLGPEALRVRLRLLLNGRLTLEETIDLDPSDLVARAARTEAIPSGAILFTDPLPRAGAIEIRPGDILTVEMRDPQGHSIFGAIERRPDLVGSGG